MSDRPRDRESVPESSLGATLEEGSEYIDEALHAAVPMAKLRKLHTLFILIAQLTIYMALVATIAYSLVVSVGRRAALATSVELPR